MADLLSAPFDMAHPALPASVPGAGVEAPIADPAPLISDEEILALWLDMRRESIDARHPFEMQWRRNIYYILNRQWIQYIQGRGWRDKRMASWIPRPVTNKCKVILKDIRSMFAGVKLGVNVRPNGNDPKNVSAASTADDLAPVIHEVHAMNARLSEFDFWFIACGNAFLHTFVDYDVKNGIVKDPTETCQTCGAEYKSSEIANIGKGACPDCRGTAWAPALDPLTGEPIVDVKPKGRPTTLVLSPLEIAFPNTYARFEDLPYVIRLRWRSKRYFESNEALAALIPQINWEKTPSDENLNLFNSLSQHNDLGVSTGYTGEITGASDEDGISEYEVWMKPTSKYPDGLVFRVFGERGPLVAHLEDTEAIPGPMPYKDAEGSPLFPFAHAGFEQVGGRLLASGPIDAIIQKQDQLNELDSMILLTIQRMANPVWLTPKGAEIQKFTGMPGLVLKWNPLTVGGNAKPERIAGEGPPAALFTIREQYLADIEDLSGMRDALRGVKPGGDTPYSALQLLVERGQSSFATAFQARGDAYKTWYKIAIELEREFGPDDRTKAILSANKTWTFQNFKRSSLQGSISVVVEDGSTVPKTSIGMRAAVEHAAGLGMLNMADPDQQYEGLKLFGLQKMVPSLDYHVQAALQKQQGFEEWAANPQNLVQAAQMAAQKLQAYQTQLAGAVNPEAPMPQPPSLLEGTPLQLFPWYSAQIHRQELMKWANSDSMRDLFKTNPPVTKFVELHLQELDAMIAQQQLAQQAVMAPSQQKMGGAAMAAQNSNRNSAGVGKDSSGSGGTAEPKG